MMSGPPKYRAFLSYSHADSRAATRVHARLEGFRIDRDLAGRQTPMGPVPVSLAPVFRDRQEFDAGGSLAELTRDALENSAALIMLASTHAATSHYVNEEVRQFRMLHPDRPVIPLIVAGPLALTRADVFPPALRFHVDPDGTVTGTSEDALAADERESSDGRALALAKVVARLIGVGPDEVFRRAERERRRKARISKAVAAVIIALLLGAGGSAWMFWDAHRRLTDATTLAMHLLGPEQASAATPTESEFLIKALKGNRCAGRNRRS
jgi:hypothetical protein